MPRAVQAGTRRSKREGEAYARRVAAASITPDYQSGWLSIASGAQRTYSHGLGVTPVLLQVLGSPNPDGSGSVYVPNPASTLNIRDVTATTVLIENTLTGTRYVRVSAWKEPV